MAGILIGVVREYKCTIMSEKKKKDTENIIDSKKLAALEARLEGLKEELEEAKSAAAEADKKVEEAQKNASDTKSDYLRLMAEFDTFRRRTAEEKLALVGSSPHPGRL